METWIGNLPWFVRKHASATARTAWGAGPAVPSWNGSEHSAEEPEAPVQIGILTKGKPTLGMALASLLLQEMRDISIHIVDTSEKPVIRRDDVVFALRLAFDREIECTYEYLRGGERVFSLGRLKLLEALRGRHICFADDDVVFASSTLPSLFQVVRAVDEYGYVAPLCLNAGMPVGVLGQVTHFGPGGIFYQDEVVRTILLEYYSTTTDVLDRKKSISRVWEIAFMTELFEALGRPCFHQRDNVCYHLDYSERLNWDLADSALIGNSLLKVRELVAKHAPKNYPMPATPVMVEHRHRLPTTQ